MKLDHIFKTGAGASAGGRACIAIASYYGSAIPPVADSVLKLLDDVGLPGELRLRRGWRWWRWSVRASLAIRYTAIAGSG